MEDIIILNNVSKAYSNGLEALKSFNLNIHKGESVGIIGPNGAGKTTLLRIILGIIKPSSGDVIIYGNKIEFISPEKLRKIGYLSSSKCIYSELTVYENLMFYCKLYHMNKNNINKYCKEFGLDNKLNIVVKKLSTGFQQRLAFICAVMHEPEIIILDEPTANLDIESKGIVIDYLNSVRKKCTIIITSHNLYEIEQLSNRIVIINNGQKMEDNDLNIIKKNHSAKTIFVTISDELTFEQKNKIMKSYDVLEITNKSITFNKYSINTSKLIKDLMESNINVENFEIKESSLEEIYFKIRRSDIK